MVVAGWMRFAAGVDEAGRPIDVRDPKEAELAAIARTAGPVATRLAPALLALFGAQGRDERVVAAVTAALGRLYAVGAARAVHV